MKLAEIRSRCERQDDHWIWGGALSDGIPRIWAPDYTNGGKMAAQNGRRAVWHLKHRKPIPQGRQVFAMCWNPLCLNPAHLEAMTRAEYGTRAAAAGAHKGILAKVIANRRINRERSSVNQALYDEIRTSSKTGAQITAETGVCRTTISRIRTGKATAFQPVGGIFTGLLAGPAR